MKLWRELQASLPSLALLLAVVGSAVLGLVMVSRGPDLPLLLAAAILGISLGWIVGTPRVAEWLVAILGVLAGSGLVVFRVARLGRRVAGALRAVLAAAWQGAVWFVSRLSPDSAANWTTVSAALSALWEDTTGLLSHLYNWAMQLPSSAATSDLVVAAVLWGLAVWVAAFWAGWAIRRFKRPLWAVTPSGLLLAAALAAEEGKPQILLPLLAATLVLLVLGGQDERESRWRKMRSGIEPGVRRALVAWGSVLSLVLVIAAAFVPAVSLEDIIEWLRPTIYVYVVEDPYASGIGFGSGTEVFDQARIVGLPRSHLVGSSPELSQQTVMRITTDELRPGQLDPPAAYYWRGLTYDQYTSAGWSTGETEIDGYAGGWRILTGTLSAERVVHQEVEVHANLGGLLHAAGELVTANEEFFVARRSPGDTFGIYIDSALLSGEDDPFQNYWVDAVLPTASERELRDAGWEYPQWVLERYLALPETIPDRVIALARDLTATAPTPYDQALAIESYLRTFPYTLDVPFPSAGQDVADYFLFELQRGYCDYYATSMVVLSRAAGLPARLAIGYASGAYDPDNGRYIVTGADAHAWPEIYFPGYGWIEFEPTAGLPPLERQDEIRPDVRPRMRFSERTRTARSPEVEELQAARSSISYGWLGLLVGAVLVVAGSGVWLAIDTRRLYDLSTEEAAATLYARLWQYAKWLALPTHRGDTPYEFAAAFTQYVNSLAQSDLWRSTVVAAVEGVQHLIQLYVNVNYIPHPLEIGEVTRAIETWQELRLRLILLGIRRASHSLVLRLRERKSGRKGE
jgi:transglutaminase-like putative cysteine protease